MAKLLKLRRGTTSQHSSFTGAEGEVTIDTDKDTAVVHDGSTAAGRPLAREDLNNVASASITSRLASGAIAGAKIANGAITSAHIAADTVVAADIAANAVGTSEIADDAVTTDKIADDAVTTAQIADDAITAPLIADNSIHSALIQNSTINQHKIANGEIVRTKIAADAVDGTKIADNSIDSEHYVDRSIDAVHIANNSITANEIAANAVGSSEIANGAVTNTQIATDTITSSEIAANAVGTSEIQADAVGQAQLADNAVVTANLTNDCVTDAKIADNAISESRLEISNTGSNGQFLQKQSGNTGGLTWATVSTDGGNAGTLDGIDSSQFLRSDAADTATNDITFASGGGAVTIAGSSDIRLTNGNWTGNTTDPKIQAHNNQLYISGGSGGIRFRENGTDRCEINGDGHFQPTANNTYDLGNSSNRWRNIYTNDLNLSNEGSVNDVDGTWGNYTIQEGEDELFLLNRRNGKKYKFNLTEVN